MQRLLRITTALVAAVGLFAFTAESAPAYTIVACSHHGWIRSSANGRYVSAELGYKGSNYGMLRARSSRVETWERFTACQVWIGKYYGTAFKSEANGKWVTAELGYRGSNYGMLRARSSTVIMSELFFCGPMPGTGGLFAYGNHNFVGAEMHYSAVRYGMLRASMSDTNISGHWGPQFEFADHFPGVCAP